MPRGAGRSGVLRGQYAKISTELKQRLTTVWQDGGEYIAAANVLNINPSTARSIILRHQRCEQLDDSRGGRREETVKLTEDVMNHVVAIVERHPDFTLQQIKEQVMALMRDQQLQLSVTSIARALDGKLITMKHLQDCPAQRNAPCVKEARSAYAEWYFNEGLNRTLVYVDESCFNIFTITY